MTFTKKYCRKKKLSNVLIQLIVANGKSAKFDYVGKIMPCEFFQVSLTFVEYHISC